MAGNSTFIQKLYAMLEDERNQHLICWNDGGDGFKVISPTEFSRKVLPMCFKHSNFSSFVRQLNMYGFHKVTEQPFISSPAALSAAGIGSSSAGPSTGPSPCASPSATLRSKLALAHGNKPPNCGESDNGNEFQNDAKESETKTSEAADCESSKDGSEKTPTHEQARTNPESSPLHVEQPWEFRHPFFKRGELHLLAQIKRKSPRCNHSSAAASSSANQAHHHQMHAVHHPDAARNVGGPAPRHIAPKMEPSLLPNEERKSLLDVPVHEYGSGAISPSAATHPPYLNGDGVMDRLVQLERMVRSQQAECDRASSNSHSVRVTLDSHKAAIGRLTRVVFRTAEYLRRVALNDEGAHPHDGARRREDAESLYEDAMRALAENGPSYLAALDHIPSPPASAVSAENHANAGAHLTPAGVVAAKASVPSYGHGLAGHEMRGEDLSAADRLGSIHSRVSTRPYPSPTNASMNRHSGEYHHLQEPPPSAAANRRYHQVPYANDKDSRNPPPHYPPTHSPTTLEPPPMPQAYREPVAYSSPSAASHYARGSTSEFMPPRFPHHASPHARKSIELPRPSTAPAPQAHGYSHAHGSNGHSPLPPQQGSAHHHASAASAHGPPPLLSAHHVPTHPHAQAHPHDPQYADERLVLPHPKRSRVQY